MPFQSDVSGHFVIDDKTDVSRIQSAESRGLIARDFNAEPHGQGYAAPFSIPLIPEHEWKDRIEAMERQKTRLTDICDFARLPPLHQGQTNYCWANGIVDCVQIVRAIQGQPTVLLSPASVAGPMTGYRNVGGWASKALEYIAKNGVASQKVWEPNAIDRRLDNAASRADRVNYNLTEWWDCRPRSMAELMTCLLLGIPCAAAYMYMSHVVTPVDPVYVNGQYGVKARNSGFARDRTGHTVLLGNRAIPDECIAPRVALAS